MDAPQYNKPELDPSFAMLLQQNQQQDIEAVRTTVQGDTASLLARYGANLAMAGTGGGSAAAKLPKVA